MPILVTLSQDIAVLHLDNPPVNAVASWMPPALLEALAAQLQNPDISAIVLCGKGRCFSAGADITAFDSAQTGAGPMRALVAALDAATKPVVAALHGYAFGGGLEIALAAHWRVAGRGTRLGLPEIQLGLIPGAGGTQYLPRLVGVAVALEMMMSGKPIEASAALERGLVDRVTEGDVVAAAVAFARTVGVRRGSGRAVEADAPALASARAQVPSRKLRGPAVSAVIDNVADAVAGPFEAGLQAEAARFDALIDSEASRGLRHGFFAERAVGRVPGLPSADAEGIRRAAVIGAGTMGGGIALALLEAGIAVTLIDLRPEALAAGAGRVRGTLEGQARRGRISESEAARRMGLLQTGAALDDAGDADIVIEAVFEDLEVKRAVFARLGQIVRPDAMLATNTSTLDVNRIAEAAALPERVVGLHFFSPANIMRLLEVVRADVTSARTLAMAMALARRIGKVGVVSGVCDGFIGNRMFEEYLRQAYLLLEEGALPAEIDDAMEAWGFALGPLRVMDLAGNDIGWSIRKRRSVEQPDRPYSRLPDLICEQRRFGQKTGAGWYLYPDGRKPMADSAVDTLVVAHSATVGLERRPVADSEITERCALALINEGARLLGEAIAARPLDVDQVWIHGYGFPAERGGPMFLADRIGLPAVLARLEELSAGREGWAFRPAPLIARLVAEGQDFASLNR